MPLSNYDDDFGEPVGGLAGFYSQPMPLPSAPPPVPTMPEQQIVDNARANAAAAQVANPPPGEPYSKTMTPFAGAVGTVPSSPATLAPSAAPEPQAPTASGTRMASYPPAAAKPSAVGAQTYAGQPMSALRRNVDIANAERASIYDNASVDQRMLSDEKTDAQNQQRDVTFQNLENTAKWAEDKRRELDQQAADVQAFAGKVASMKVDPSRLMKSKGAAGEIIGALGALFGGAGAALTGGQNQFLAIYNAAVDRDIDAQKEELANARDSLGQRRGLYSEALRQFGDERQAKLATASAYANAWGRVIDNVAAKQSDEAMRTKLLDAGAQIRQDVADKALAERQRQEATAASAAASQQKSAVEMYKWEREMALKEAQAAASSKEAIAKQQKEDRANYVPDPSSPSGGWLANSPTQADKMREQSAAYGAITDLLDQMKRDAGGISVGDKAVHKATFGVYKPEQIAKVEKAAALLIPQISQFLGSGTPQEGEAKRFLEVMAGNPSAFLQSPEKHVGLFLDRIKTLRQGQLSRSGLVPATRDIETGNVSIVPGNAPKPLATPRLVGEAPRRK